MPFTGCETLALTVDLNKPARPQSQGRVRGERARAPRGDAPLPGVDRPGRPSAGHGLVA